MIILINGAFGIGKTTAGRLLVARLPRAILFDPELIGGALQRLAALIGRRPSDFQDLRIWRRLTIFGLRVVRKVWPDVVVPMAFSNITYLEEIRHALSAFEPKILHICLVAPVAAVHERISHRKLDPDDAAWQYRRASECCFAHQGDDFATKIDAVTCGPDEIADEILRIVAEA